MNLTSFKDIGLKQKIIANSALMIAIILGIIFFVIIPGLNSVKGLMENIISQKIELEQTMIKEKNNSKISEKIKKIEPQMSKFEQIFINQNRELEFITTLEDIANKNKVAQKISLTPVLESGGNFKKTPLNITAKGEFKNIMEYLTGLESSNYYINIKSIELASSRARAPKDQDGYSPNAPVNIKIFALTYWR